jgi:hypothetical protein
MEIEPQFVDTAIRRWQQFSGKDAVHAETGKSFAMLEDQRRSSSNLKG